MAEASLALAERRAGDLKVATEKLGGTPPTNRQLLMLRVMGVIAPPKSAGLPRRIGGILLVILAIVLVLVARLGHRQADRAAVRRDRQHGVVLRLPAGRRRARRARLLRAHGASERRGRRPPSNAPRRSAGEGRLTFRGGSRVAPSVLPPFWTLVETHGDELLVHARRLAGDEHAEDVLQDALLRALRAYPRLRHADHLRAWLYRVTTSAAMDHHRARRREVVTDDPPRQRHPRCVRRRRLREPDRTAQRDRPHAPCGCASSTTSTTTASPTRLGCSTVAARQRVSTAVRTLRESFA